MLKFLKEKGYKVPKKGAPSGNAYHRLEEAFIQEAEASGMSIADFDLSLWNRYSSAAKRLQL
jgi:hypothetical protein